MTKDYDSIYNSFIEELKANDKKVMAEMNSKSREQMSKEFASFIKKNNCKIRSDKHGKR